MDQSLILGQIRAVCPRVVKIIQKADADFNAGVLAAYRAYWLRGKAKLMSLSVERFMKEEFGVDPNKPLRVQTIGGFPVLIVEGDNFNVGIRFKKYSREYLSYQHRSRLQDQYRRTGSLNPSLPGMSQRTYHIIVGCRFTGGLEPKMIDIAITSERQSKSGSNFLEWCHVIWDARSGMEPARPVTMPLPFPTRPAAIKPEKQYGVRAKKQRGDKDVQGKTGTDSNGG